MPVSICFPIIFSIFSCYIGVSFYFFLCLLISLRIFSLAFSYLPLADILFLYIFFLYLLSLLPFSGHFQSIFCLCLQFCFMYMFFLYLLSLLPFFTFLNISCLCLQFFFMYTCLMMFIILSLYVYLPSSL